MNKTIKVTGKGKISIKPDLTNIILEFSGVYREYNVALEHSVNDVKEVKEVLKNLGFENDELKTTKFNIDTAYESYYDEKNNYRSKFVGYKYTQTLRVSFKNDNRLLGAILYGISNLKVDPKISISYSVSDEENAKNALLSNAIKDAIKKANIIAMASNITLGDIIDINYSYSTISFECGDYLLASRNYSKLIPDSSYDIDIEPEDIHRSDDVNIIFEIK